MTKEQERLSEEAIARKRLYDAEYIKEKYVRKSISIPKEEYQEYEKLLKDNKLTKMEFLRLSMKALKEGKIKREY